MGAVLLDGEDACHISKGYIGLVLEPGSQEVKILLLQILSVTALAKDAVPFVNDNYKLKRSVSSKYLCVGYSSNKSHIIDFFSSFKKSSMFCV